MLYVFLVTLLFLFIVFFSVNRYLFEKQTMHAKYRKYFIFMNKLNEISYNLNMKFI